MNGTIGKKNSANSVLLIEPLSKHWTTVEAVVPLFLKNNWDVMVYAPEFIRSTIRQYENSPEFESKLEFFEENPFRFFRILLGRSYKCVIMSNKYYNIKIKNKSIKTYIRFIIEKSILFIFFLFKSKRTFIIISSHFVKGLEFNAKTTSQLLTNISKIVWKFGIKRTNAINVYSSLVRNAIVQITKKPTLIAPNAIFKNYSCKNTFGKNEKFLIVLPGRIDQRRRYYEWINKLSSDISNYTDIFLLGVANSETDKKWIKLLSDKGFKQPNINTGNFISQEIYEKYMNLADLFFAPLTHLQSKNSAIDRNLGPFYDAIRYGKPILIPDYAPIDDNLRENVLVYKNDDELIGIIKKMAVNINFYNDITKKAYNNSLRFSIDNLKYVNELEELINYR